MAFVYTDEYQLMYKDTNGNWHIVLNGNDPQIYASPSDALTAGKLLTEDWANNIRVTNNHAFTVSANITETP